MCPRLLHLLNDDVSEPEHLISSLGHSHIAKLIYDQEKHFSISFSRPVGNPPLSFPPSCLLAWKNLY